jgi:hypothetical protein
MEDHRCMLCGGGRNLARTYHYRRRSDLGFHWIPIPARQEQDLETVRRDGDVNRAPAYLHTTTSFFPFFFFLPGLAYLVLQARMSILMNVTQQFRDSTSPPKLTESLRDTTGS